MPKAAPSTTTTISLSQARAAFFAAQGFVPGRNASLLPTLERTGFVRTLGGVDVYLAVRARVPGMARADLDRAVEKHEAQVLPSVRGCIYLVPKREVPFALRAADLLSRSRALRDQERAGLRRGEVEQVAKEALAALRKLGPSTTDAIRRALPEGTLRSLGEAGKKVGVSSALPPALRLLEFEGKIERTLEGGRLDTERYLWRAVEKSPLEAADLPDDPIDLWARLGEVFFRAAGLGTTKAFAEWAGISQRDATAAAAKLPLVPVSIEGVAETHFALEAERRALLEAGGAQEAIAFLPFEDNLVALRGGPAILVHSAHHGLSVPVWGSAKKEKLGEARYMSFRSVVAEGKVVGFWEYDPDSKKAIFACFDKVKPPTRKRLAEAAAEVSKFIAQDLGHGRSFSIDTEDELRKRVKLVRTLE
jgi:hypothetical protein